MTSLQLIQAFPFDAAPHYVIRDRDSIYGKKVVAALRTLGIEEQVNSCQAPWRDGYDERVVASIRPSPCSAEIAFNIPECAFGDCRETAAGGTGRCDLLLEGINGRDSTPYQRNKTFTLDQEDSSLATTSVA